MKKSLALSLCALALPLAAAEPVSLSGIYPELAMFNNEGECGTGAVVPWADKLWVVTYAPHMPKGSSDKLYEIGKDMRQTVRPESVGGTPANRMIHRESNQLFIGPYVIDAQASVRVISPTQMFGRLTGMARDLTDPANKICYATMEEGIYEVDVHSLAVKELWADEQRKEGRHADLPGYHGKGFYSGFGRLVYANNGDHDKKALTDPTIPSGVLATWDGKAEEWTVVRRNQFTEVTGPGGIEGNVHPEKDPVWTIGWDHRSLILMMLDGGQWSAFRLPKASHCYDGAHGWNTEWPRIREIGEGDDWLMTMHGMFWHFPRGFSTGHTAGIAPRSTYLKVVGDFCRWGDNVVLGCDDTAKSEFLNKSKLKGPILGPGQSQSNLRFVKPSQLDQFGPALGRGAVWEHDAVKSGEWSDPFLFSGFARRGLHLMHTEKKTVTFALETDAGDGVWRKLREVTVPAGESLWQSFSSEDKGAWIRLKADQDLSDVSAVFQYSAEDCRTGDDAIFAGLARFDGKDFMGGVVRTRGDNKRTLSLAAATVAGGTATLSGYYELNDRLELKKVDDSAAEAYTRKAAAVPAGVISSDTASVLVVDDHGRRWRLPKTDAAYDHEGAVPLRVDREVSTERDLLNAHGTFYELPAANAGGFAKIRPVSSHHLQVHDYCSYRGLLIMTGIAADAPTNNPHVIRSDDGKAALWAGAIDDLWSLGKPVGHGGPWNETAAMQDQPSDPYLMMGYDKKSLTLSHQSASTVGVTVQVDITGMGDWVTYKTFEVKPGTTVEETFPAGYQAYWLRMVADNACTATAQLKYE